MALLLKYITYVMFQAIHHLGIPTTRAGTCITCDNEVVRDLNYNGNPIMEKITLVLRISPTFLRLHFW